LIYHLSGGTNNVSFLSTNNPGGSGFVVPIPRAGNVTIQLSAAAESGSTSNIVLNLDRSVEGVTSGTAAATRWQNTFLQIPMALTSTTTNTVLTNLTTSLVGGTGFLRINIANTNAAGRATNIWLITSTKPGI
jgi:hypothetical protein